MAIDAVQNVAEGDGTELPGADASPPLHASATGRVAMVLLAFGGDRVSEELTVSDIARSLGRERSQVSRMLKVLAAAGLLEQNPQTRAYRLGWQLYQLANRAGDQRLLSAAQPALRDLVIHSRETALLSVLLGNRSLTVARERSTQSVQAGGWVGRTSPLHASASGRALILGMRDEEVKRLVRGDLRDRRLGPKAPTSIAAVLRTLNRERAQGYTVAVDQLEDGLTSVGAPVIDAIGRTIATINVSGPTSRLAPKLDSVTGPLVATSRQVSARLNRAASPQT